MSVDLRTRYLGLDLRSPLVASASPVTGQPDYAVRLEQAGAAAIVMTSLFEEEILSEELELNRSLEQGTEHFAEALDYFPALPSLATAADRYLDNLERLKSRLSVPVIASLNATTSGGWVEYAGRLADAGADALELNVYHLVADPTATAADAESADLELIASVRAALDIPLAVKLSPYYSALAGFARAVVDHGADGLVLFNRFYQPDLDLETLDVVPRIELSRQWELRLPLRWIAILRPQLGTHVSLAATSGVHTGTDAVKALAVGADVAMMTSALLHHGPDHVRLVEEELLGWLAQNEYESVSQLRGSASAATAENPSAFERANYLKTLRSWSAPAALESMAALGPAITLSEPAGSGDSHS
jgi:dihydroorotate dehydrogenase (fumarate)